ncbi:MAG: FAD:protein FMN transferase [Verrucomicrobia bacterium]|nr:FAD:protein FMN transferase [Verrucomicrobiota bacterium]MBI3870070.1 FAD:protein FMN transferase [Verrucomicrobiota bacterium]
MRLLIPTRAFARCRLAALTQTARAVLLGCFLLILGGALLDARQPPLRSFQFTEAHMGTMWSITCYGPDRETVSSAAKAAFQRVAELDAMMTDYDSNSELLRLGEAQSGVAHPISRELLEVMAAAQKVSRESEGAFDITAGPLIQAWRRARRQRELPSGERLAEALSVVGYTNLSLDLRHSTATLRVPRMRLDLGGIAKGFAADAALEVLRRHGIRRALVAASGDLAIGDAPPGERGWKIRVGDPESRTNVLAFALYLKNVGVSTSGDAEQFVRIEGKQYSHIVDPATGSGLTNRVQATVIADSATRSDAWATAACILGVEKGTRALDRDRRLSALFVVPGPATGLRLIPTRRFPAGGP